MRILKDGLLLLVFAGVVAGQERAAEPSVQVSGRVIDGEGRPIEGAAVRVLPKSDQRRHALEFTTDDLLARPDAVTDAAGAFTVRAPEDPMLHVAARGHIAATVRCVSSADDLAAVGEITVVLPDGAVHLGTVRDATGEPVAGAWVRAGALVGGSWRLAGLYQTASTATRTDERGRFRLLCAPRAAMRVEVDAAGHFRAIASPVGEGTPLNFVVEPSGFVTGRVVGRDGEPRVGLELGVRYEMESRHDYVACVTDAEGHFRTTVAEPGRLRMYCYDRETMQHFAGPILDGPSEDVLVQPVAALDQAGRAERFELRLRDQRTGAPVVGARVDVSNGGSRGRYVSTAKPGPNSPWGHGDFPETDADGAVQLDLPPTEAQQQRGEIWIRAEGYSARIEDVDLSTAEFPLVYDLREEAVIHGHVVDVAGKPVAGAEVFWVRCASVASYLSFGGPQVHAVSTDAAGAYELRGVPRGKIEVIATTADHVVPRPAVVDTDVDASRFELDFTLEAARRFEVALPDDVPRGGLALAWAVPRPTPLPGERPQANYRRAGTSSAVFDAQGRVVVQLDVRGDLQLTVQRLSRVVSPYVLDFDLPDFAGADGSEIAVPTSALATARITGKVVTDGIPFSRFAVMLVDPSCRSGPMRPSAAQIRVPVDASGRFEAEVLPGSHLLTLVDLQTGLTVFERDEPVEVGPDDSVDLQVEPRCCRVRIRLVAARGADAPFALGSLRVIGPTSAALAAQRPPMDCMVPWRPGEPVDLLLPPGSATVYLQDGAASLTKAGSWREEKVAEVKFDVRGDAPSEVVLELPPPTPTEAIDR